VLPTDAKDDWPDPAPVLAENWGNARRVSVAHAGVSRLTWRVEGVGWLSAVPQYEHLELERELRLLKQLGRPLADFGVAVPTPVPARTGDEVLASAGWSWRMSAHLPGGTPDLNDPEHYRATSRSLAVVHRVLAGLSPLLAVRGESQIDLAARAVHDIPEWARAPLNPQSDEARSLDALAAVVQEALPTFRSDQLIHGDWATPNLLVESRGDICLTGILDWQECAVGSTLLDLAQAASSVLMWSSLPTKAVGLDAVLDGYRSGGGSATVEGLKTAVATYWLAQYARLRARVARSGFDPHVRGIVQRNPSRLRAALDFACG
jgi:aminoglycoside phosphotransferase (APT) family kinase protein